MLKSLKIRDRRAGWLWIANSVYDNFAGKVHPSTFMVYTALCRYANNDDQTCCPSYETLADMLNLSRATVATALSELRDFKLISWQKVGRHNEYSLLDVDQSSLNSLKFRLVQKTDTTSLKNVAKASNPLDANKTYNKTKEQELNPGEVPPADEFSLLPDEPKKKSKEADPRWTPFKEKLEKFWKHLNSAELYWTPADSKQLADFLKHWPTVALEKFHDALVNYMESENIIGSRSPREFLPKLHLYFDSPLDKYNKPIKERTVH